MKLNFRFSVKRKHFALPYSAFLLALVIVPLFTIFYFAVIDKSTGRLTFQYFKNVFTDGAVLPTLWRSLWISVVTTVLCLVIGYPAAYMLSRMKKRTASVMIILFMLPMWINFVLRTMATKLALVQLLGIESKYFVLLFGMVYDFLPFMILPLYTMLSNMDKSLIEAAQDLGAKPRQVFMRTILPLSLPGVISGVIMVFIPALTTFAISAILTEGRVFLIGNMIENYVNYGIYGYAGAISIVMMLFIGLTMLLNGKFGGKGAGARGGVV